jgi:hypothetical protein
MRKETSSCLVEDDSLRQSASRTSLGKAYDMYFEARCDNCNKIAIGRENRPLKSCSMVMLGGSFLGLGNRSYLDQSEVLVPASLIQAQTSLAKRDQPLPMVLVIAGR